MAENDLSINQLLAKQYDIDVDATDSFIYKDNIIKTGIRLYKDLLTEIKDNMKDAVQKKKHSFDLDLTAFVAEWLIKNKSMLPEDAEHNAENIYTDFLAVALNLDDKFSQVSLQHQTVAGSDANKNAELKEQYEQSVQDTKQLMKFKVFNDSPSIYFLVHQQTVHTHLYFDWSVYEVFIETVATKNSLADFDFNDDDDED